MLLMSPLEGSQAFRHLPGEEGRHREQLEIASIERRLTLGRRERRVGIPPRALRICTAAAPEVVGRLPHGWKNYLRRRRGGRGVGDWRGMPWRFEICVTAPAASLYASFAAAISGALLAAAAPSLVPHPSQLT